MVKVINQLNNFTEETKDYDENLPNCQYRDFGYFQNFSEKFKSKSLSLLHLNICSLSKNFDNFCILLKEINMNFDIIALTESRIKKNLVTPINIELENYSNEHTPIEIAAGGALLYINKRLSYYPRNYLNIYMPGKLESIFIEIVCPKSSNIFVNTHFYL